MHWHKLTVQITAGQLEPLETLLWDLAAVSVTVSDSEDDPIFEPGPGETPLWPNIDVCGLFEQDVQIEAVLEQVEQAGYKVLFTERLGDRPWEREWLVRFKAMKFGKRLWVCPTGQQVTEQDAVVMDLDPGLAFGTGTHPTTQLCLQWLDGADVQNRRVVDYGCGSGILGIAALLLGASEVIAVDNDPQALTATRDNASRNKVDSRLTTLLPDQFAAAGHEGGIDIVLANILAQPLIELAGPLSQLLKKEGHLVLSGIMKAQQSWVESAYTDKMNFIGQQLDDGWVCLQARK